MSESSTTSSVRADWSDVAGFAVVAFVLGYLVSEARSRRLVNTALSRWGHGDDATRQPPALSDLLGRVDHIGQLATRDALTGAANRQRALDDLDRAASAAHDQASWIGVCIIDLDHFKTVNDTYGHDAGDAVLLTVAERLRADLSDGETLGRIGGEEFLLVLPRHDLEQTSDRAEALRHRVEAAPVQLADGREVMVTASIGAVATYGERSTAEQLRSAADQALYRAKDAGRNVVVRGEVSR